MNFVPMCCLVNVLFLSLCPGYEDVNIGEGGGGGVWGLMTDDDKGGGWVKN